MLQKGFEHQLVFHNLDVAKKAEDIDSILQNGLWVPEHYAILSVDVTFWGFSHTFVFDTPTAPSTEYTYDGTGQDLWTEIRIRDPIGPLFPLDDESIPRTLIEKHKKLLIDKLTGQPVRKFRRVAPEHIQALLEWSDDGLIILDHKCYHTLKQMMLHENESLVHVTEHIVNLIMQTQHSIRYLKPGLAVSDLYTSIAQSIIEFRYEFFYAELLQSCQHHAQGKLSRAYDYLEKHFDLEPLYDPISKQNSEVPISKEEMRVYFLKANNTLLSIKCRTPRIEAVQTQFDNLVRTTLRSSHAV